MTGKQFDEPLFVYFHVASMRYGRLIFNQIAKEIVNSGLNAAASEIHISIVGTKKMKIDLPGNTILHEDKDLKKENL